MRWSCAVAPVGLLPASTPPAPEPGGITAQRNLGVFGVQVQHHATASTARTQMPQKSGSQLTRRASSSSLEITLSASA